MLRSVAHEMSSPKALVDAPLAISGVAEGGIVPPYEEREDRTPRYRHPVEE